MAESNATKGQNRRQQAKVARLKPLLKVAVGLMPKPKIEPRKSNAVVRNRN